MSAMHSPSSTEDLLAAPMRAEMRRTDRPPPSGVGAFDFLIGTWTVRHRRLMRRLARDDRWLEFGGRSSMRTILGGLGNIDENVIDLPEGGYAAATLRLFDASLQRWSIWWVDGRNPVVETPVHGSFNDGIGTFYGDDTFEGRPIVVRFVWSAITSCSARWEQAFSEDRGQTWEANWIMNFERLA